MMAKHRLLGNCYLDGRRRSHRRKCANAKSDQSYGTGQSLDLPALLQGQGQAFEATAGGEAAAYQAQVARNNAIIAGYNATEAEQAGETQAYVTSQTAAAQGGRIKAAQAADNIDVNRRACIRARWAVRCRLQQKHAGGRLMAFASSLTSAVSGGLGILGALSSFGAAQTQAQAGVVRQAGVLNTETVLNNAELAGYGYRSQQTA
jgi:hypothetical protein